MSIISMASMHIRSSIYTKTWYPLLIYKLIKYLSIHEAQAIYTYQPIPINSHNVQYIFVLYISLQAFMNIHYNCLYSCMKRYDTVRRPLIETKRTQFACR